MKDGLRPYPFYCGEAAADYFFRLLKYGGEEASRDVYGAAETCTAAKRGVYFYEKDRAALGAQDASPLADAEEDDAAEGIFAEQESGCAAAPCGAE